MTATRMPAATYRDPTRRSIEKTLLGFDRAHQITSNGTYELPFGMGHTLLGNAPNWVQQVVNRWQLGGIMNFNSGATVDVHDRYCRRHSPPGRRRSATFRRNPTSSALSRKISDTFRSLRTASFTSAVIRKPPTLALPG